MRIPGIKIFFFSLILYVLVFPSCKEKETYPIEPAIEFKSLTFSPFSGYVGGSALLKMNFTDGDGDLGLTDIDTLPPHDYNLFINIFYQDSGKMKPLIFPDSTLTFNARVPYLETNSNNKTLKGEIEYRMDLISDDTLQMEVYVKDRALHLSNKITTPKFTVKGGVIQ